MRSAVCPGSFDPPTRGHLDVVRRAAAIFDSVTVAILVNESKVGLFDVERRRALLLDALGDCGNVEVDTFSGLLVDYCRRRQIDVIVKGLRTAGDAEYEFAMAHMNRHVAGVETIFLAADPALSFVSSSLVKEVTRLGGDVSGLVTPAVHRALRERLAPDADEERP